MNFESQLKDRIVAECEKLIERYHAYHNHLHQEWVRTLRRISGAPPKRVMTPEHWDIDPKFNPFHVRRTAAAIARSIAKKIALQTYSPHAPHRKKIPKAGGGERELTIYQIPDAALNRPGILWRLQPLRRWSHEQVEQVLT